MKSSSILVSVLLTGGLAFKTAPIYQPQRSVIPVPLGTRRQGPLQPARAMQNAVMPLNTVQPAKIFFPLAPLSMQEELQGLKGFHGFDPKPPLRQLEKPAERLVQRAQRLSDWMRDSLEKEGAMVAVVARGGSWQSKTQDKTGMEHSGVAVYLPWKRNWRVFELLNHDRGVRPQQTTIWQTKPVDFFYGHDLNALLLIPDRKTQWKMWLGLVSGQYKKLHFTRNYNLVTPPESQRSLNCNKWTLMNVIAARLGNYRPRTILEAVPRYLEPGLIRVPPVLRPIAKQHPTVMQDEVPVLGPIETVTVESLSHSPLFEKALYFRKPGCWPPRIDQRA